MKKNGWHIYHLFIKGEIVVKEEDQVIISMSSGFGYANDKLVHG